MVNRIECWVRSRHHDVHGSHPAVAQPLGPRLVCTSAAIATLSGSDLADQGSISADLLFSGPAKLSKVCAAILPVLGGWFWESKAAVLLTRACFAVACGESCWTLGEFGT